MRKYCPQCKTEVNVINDSGQLFCEKCETLILPSDQAKKERATKEDVIRVFGGVENFILKAIAISWKFSRR